MCPLTPEETALTLRALDVDPKMQIYIAAGDIYGGEKRMEPLRKAFPNLVNSKLQCIKTILFKNKFVMNCFADTLVCVRTGKKGNTIRKV